MLFQQNSIEWFEFGSARLGLLEDFIADHDRLYQSLVDTIDWETPLVNLYGKSYPTPRKVAFYGDIGKVYRYSGVEHQALPWLASLQSINVCLDSVLNTRFNTVLLNCYRDGRDSMGFHADDESELGKNPLIASVSLGATRRFVIKSKSNKAMATKEINLNGGSLLVMAGSFQHDFVHAVPAERKVNEGRINLTFRNIL